MRGTRMEKPRLDLWSGISMVTLLAPVATDEFGPKRLDLAPHLDRKPLDPALDTC